MGTMNDNNHNNVETNTATDAIPMGNDVAANVVATFSEDAESTVPAPVESDEGNLRFADLDLDESPETPALPAVVPERPMLEIDGVDVESAPSESVSSEGAALAALNKAGLNFEVKLVQPVVAPQDIPYGSSWVQPPNAEEFNYCMRMDTGRIFGVTSPDYGFVQPSELAELVDAALPEGAGDVKVRSSAFGDHLWFDCELPEGTFEVTPEMQADADSRGWVHVDPRVDGRTPVKAKLLFKHAYGGKGSYDVWMLLEALICGNGMRVALQDGKRQLKIRHTVNFESRVQDLRRAFEVAGGAVKAFTGILQEAGRTQITLKQFDEYCEHLFPGESTQAKNKRKRLALLNSTAVGCAPGTAWGALQSATYFATHETEVRVQGRSLKHYTLDDPNSLNGAQIESIQGQARLEAMAYGNSGAFTEKALQYVTNNWMELS
ncbi:MAG: DUF932 domain-containing protein [Candidatus Altiarchaeales archaeon]|nr:DUF932 domain-containing protein [Candidatus Altiarchaeales archaeon]